MSEHEETPSKNFGALLKSEELPKIAQLLGVSPARLAATATLLERLVGFTGLNVGLHIPEALSSYDPSLWHAFITIEKLKHRGWIESANWVPRVYPDEPALLQYLIVNTGLSPIEGFGGSGADFFSKERAVWAALGEAIERRALAYYTPEQYIDAPSHALAGRAIDLANVVGVHPALRTERPNLQFDEQSVFRWIPAQSLLTHAEKLLPLQLISIEHPAGEPILRLPISTGAAAHTERVQAMLTGTLELIERDAFMISWMNKLSVPKIALESIPSERVQEVVAQFKKFNLTLTLLYLPTDFAVHAVLGVLTDPTGVGPALALGASARCDLLEAIEKTLSEVQSCRFYVRSGSDGKYRSTKPAGDYRLADIGREERLFYWATPAHASQASFLFEGSEYPFSAFPTYANGTTAQERLDVLRQQFIQKGLELLTIPLLSAATEKEIEFVALQMCAPGLQPMHLLEALPYNAGERLDTVAAACGYTPLSEKNTLPHPFP